VDSDRVSRARSYSGGDEGGCRVSPTGLLPFVASRSKRARLPHTFVTPRPRCGATTSLLQPRLELGPQAIALERFGLVPFRSPLLRESRFLSFPPVTEMCQFTGLASPALCVQAGIRAHYHAWVPPFGDPRVNGCSAPHRGLSQPSTSFFASWRQGIHRVPFVS
jgi:hypothetical protein